MAQVQRLFTHPVRRLPRLLLSSSSANNVVVCSCECPASSFSAIAVHQNKSSFSSSNNLLRQQQFYKSTLAQGILDEQSIISSGDGVRPRHCVEPTPREKWMLVYTRAYPDFESIPESVPATKIAKSQDKVRSRFALVLSVTCFLFCIGACAVASLHHRRNRSRYTRN